MITDEKLSKLLKDAHEYVSTGILPPQAKAEFKSRPQLRNKKRSFKSPYIYQVVEEIVDYEILLKRHLTTGLETAEFEELLKSYFRIRRIIRGS